MIYNLHFPSILTYSKKKYKHTSNRNLSRAMVRYPSCYWNRISVAYIYIDPKIAVNHDKQISFSCPYWSNIFPLQLNLLKKSMDLKVV